MTLLILSGTGAGREIAETLHKHGRPVLASLSGATRAPRGQSVPTRIGGFGGGDAFGAFLKSAGISAVLDATHPFAAKISERSARVCAQQNIPYCQYMRPAWTATEADTWTMLNDESEAARFIETGATVFLATGRKTLKRFANLSNCTLICRQIDPPDGPFPFPNGKFLIGRPPFSVEDEIALFKSLNVDWLVVKNAGGAASFSKLEAARALGIRVGMIKRPPAIDALVVSEISQAIEWGMAVG